MSPANLRTLLGAVLAPFTGKDTPTVTDANAIAHLHDAQASIAAAIAELTPTPPSPPSAYWDWDAENAPTDPTSGKVMPGFQAYAVAANGGPYATSAVAWAGAVTSDPAYDIPLTSQKSAPTIHAVIPLHTQGGRTMDRSLAVRQPDGSFVDLAPVNYDPTTGKIKSAGYGAPVAKGAVNETGPGSGNAAGFPLGIPVVHPADLEEFRQSGGGLKVLSFSCPNVGPGPSRVPARPGVSNYPGNTGLNLGSWIGLEIDAVLGASATLLEAYLFACLLKKGAMLRDINPAPNGTLSFILSDEVNQGDNVALWAAAGVALTGKGVTGLPYLVKLTGRIPWAKLRLITQPTV